MATVIVVHGNAVVRARLLDALAKRGLPAAAVTDLEGALDHPLVGEVRVVLADPELLEKYEFAFATQIGVRAGSTIRVIALVDVADPARKKALERHDALLLERSIDDHDALAAQVVKQSGPPVKEVVAPRAPSLGRINVERVQIDSSAFDAPVSSQGERPMVLVVEDDEAARSFLATLLEQRGYRVHTVSSATSALRFLGREEAVHLIVSDIDMPQMDGFELKYALKGSPIPFIAVAGDDSDERQQLAKQLGMIALLGKPVQVKPFCELVRGTLLGTSTSAP